MTQEELYLKALAYRKEENWGEALNCLEECLSQGDYPKAQQLKEFIEDILSFFCTDWLNP